MCKILEGLKGVFVYQYDILEDRNLKAALEPIQEAGLKLSSAEVRPVAFSMYSPILVIKHHVVSDTWPSSFMMHLVEKWIGHRSFVYRPLPNDYCPPVLVMTIPHTAKG